MTEIDDNANSCNNYDAFLDLVAWKQIRFGQNSWKKNEN